VDGRTLLAGEADDLMTAILDAESKSILDDGSAAQLAGRPADWTIEVRLARGAGWSVKLRPFRGDVAATVSRRPGAFVVSADAASRLRGAIEKAAAPPTVTPPAQTPAPSPTARRSRSG
jgi:hypothetical protein